MQISGSQFTSTVALAGNDLSTFPDFPAEIRAPAGTLPGVSGYQLHFSSNEIYTPGDAVDVLIVMNPAALKMNLADLKANGILIVNSDAFAETDLRKAQMTSNPLEDHSLDKYRLFSVELERLTKVALEHLGLDAKSVSRCKNFFALGMCYWLYNRSMDSTVRWIEDKFSKKPRHRSFTWSQPFHEGQHLRRRLHSADMLATQRTGSNFVCCKSLSKNDFETSALRRATLISGRAHNYYNPVTDMLKFR